MIIPSSTLDTQILAHDSLRAVLDALDALVYVADMETHEIYFINAYGRKIWGDATGKKCWDVLQTGQTGPCAFCTNPKLLDAAGKPSGVQVWEFQNTVNGNWYQCRDQAITWINGRTVRIEIATNITALKTSLQALDESRRTAEALSRTDELTGIRNRRALLDDTRLLFNLARRYGTGLIVALLDLDHFKKINDRHGHAVGDEVLVQMAAAVRRSIRDVDVFGRFGGEEFVLALPGLDAAHGLQALERLRDVVSKLAFNSGQNRFHVTCSMGVAVMGREHLRLETLLDEADRGLYRAKQAGRNQVRMDQLAATV